jgi:chromosome partitioning protein
MLRIMYVLAVANHKGGVGKSFTSVQIATELARRGERVLLVDADAQAHSTLYLMGDDAAEIVEPDLSHILDGTSLADIVVAISPEGFWLAPSTLRVAEMDMRLVADTGRRDQRFKRALQRVEADYGYVVIDCPPALSLVTINALAAADAILAPVTLTNFALKGLARFLRWVDQFRAEGIVQAELLAVLPTMYSPRQSADREGLITLHNSGLPLLEPVPRRTSVEQVVAARMATVADQESAGELAAAPRALPALAAPYRAAVDRIMEAAGARPGELART